MEGPSVRLSQPADVTLALPAAGRPGSLWHGQSQPQGGLCGTVPATSPFPRVLPAVGCLGGLLGFPIGADVFPLLSSCWVIFYLLFQKWLNFSSALSLALVKSRPVWQDGRVNVQSVRSSSADALSGGSRTHCVLAAGRSTNSAWSLLRYP